MNSFVKSVVGVSFACLLLVVEPFTSFTQKAALSSSTRVTSACGGNANLSQRNVGDADIVATAVCTVGVLTNIRVKVYQSHVLNNPNTADPADPNVWRLIREIPVSCSSVNCASPQRFVQNISRTQYLRVILHLDTITTDGRAVSTDRPAAGLRLTQVGMDTWVYNDAGAAYPVVQSPRFSNLRAGAVPFPLVPYPACPGSPSCPPISTSTLRRRFRTDLISFYTNRSYPLPQSPFQAHHIKPLEWGGDWNAQINGVLLPDPNHRLFTNWWGRRGVSGSFNPVRF